jgi:hypothetical protein
MSNEALVKAENAALPPARQTTGETPVQFDLNTMIEAFGNIELNSEQQAILFAPPDEKELDVRPDGLIFAPWISYAKRLRTVFGMAWGLVPAGEAKIVGELVVRPFYLVIKGKPVGFAVGECRYSMKNLTMSWGDAIEGAKSNALSRLCKGIGMMLELWDRGYSERWREKYAKLIIKDGKQQWVRADSLAAAAPPKPAVKQ